MLEKIKKYKFYLYIIGIVMIKLLLVQTIPIFSMSPAASDDQLMVNLANSLIEGKWLGAYNDHTLVKGMFYPFFLAFNHFLGIPYLSALTLFYSFGCFIFVIAIKKVFKTEYPLYFIFTVLLFNPVSYATQTFLVTYRNSITPAQVLIIIGAVIAIYLNIEKQPRKCLPWAVLAGLTLASLWHTREDGIWILPFIIIAIILIIGSAIKYNYKIKRKECFEKIGIAFLPIVILLISTVFISTINYSVYGIFTTNELNGSNFKKAIDAFYSVKPNEKIEYVSVPRSTLNSICDNSDTLNTIRAELNESFDFWEDCGRNPGDMEVEDGWFFWALRYAAKNAGIYENAEKANAFWGNVSDEIQKAIMTGKLEERTTMPSALMSPWREEYYKKLPQAFINVGKFLVTYSDMKLDVSVSIPDAGTGIRMAEVVTNNHAIYPPQISNTVSGWIASLSIDEKFSLELVDENNNEIKPVELIASPDVEVFFKSQNIELENTKNCRFYITIDESVDMKKLKILVHDSSNNIVETIPLDGSMTVGKNEKYYFTIDSYVSDPLAEKYSVRVNFMNKLINIYRKTSVPLVIFGGVCYLWIGFSCVFNFIKRRGKKTTFSVWLILSALLGSLIILMMGISYNEIASCPSINYKYLSGAYPLLIGFWSIGLTWTLENYLYKLKQK